MKLFRRFSIQWWRKQSTEDIQHQIQAMHGSLDIRNPKSSTSLREKALQDILSERGADKVGDNGCTGGSKQRGVRGRSF